MCVDRNPFGYIKNRICGYLKHKIHLVISDKNSGLHCYLKDFCLFLIFRVDKYHFLNSNCSMYLRKKGFNINSECVW